MNEETTEKKYIFAKNKMSASRVIIRGNNIERK